MMLRRFFITTLFVSLSLLFAQLSIAQDDPQESTQDSDIQYSINVTAVSLEESLSEKSDSVTVVDRNEIERHQWKFVSEALRDVAGIAIVQSGSAGKTTSAFVRGAASEQLLVLVDGMQIN